MNRTDMSHPRIGGMLIGYYVLCPRKAWLSMRGLLMEQESEAVALGRLVGQTSYARREKELMVTATAPDGTPLVGKLDGAQLDAGVICETKRSPKAADAHRWQLRFYLWLLKLDGVTGPGGDPLIGRLEYPSQRQTDTVRLTPEHETRLEEMVAALSDLVKQPTPPPRLDRRSFCRTCAYEELCYA